MNKGGEAHVVSEPREIHEELNNIEMQLDQFAAECERDQMNLTKTFEACFMEPTQQNQLATKINFQVRQPNQLAAPKAGPYQNNFQYVTPVRRQS